MAIVVLGGGITKKGILPLQVKKRVKKAFELYKKNEKEKIVLSGKYSFLYPKNQLPPITEAEAMKKELLNLGVSSKKIFLEKKSRDTISNAYYLKTTFFIPKKEKKATIITSEFHKPRVKFIFKKIFGPSYKFQFIGLSSPALSKEEKKKILERQKYLVSKTKEILKGMKTGKHNFLKGKFYKIEYYTKKRPAWVIKFVTQGK